MLPFDRTARRYKEFLQKRRAFLWDRVNAFGDAQVRSEAGAMREVIDAWLVPLWVLVGEAHFSARWREGEKDFDWATFGGRFTVKMFMDILEGKD